MKIQFMAMCYAPEDISGALLVTELATDLAKRGHRVTMVAPAPNYPYGVVFPGYRNHLLKTEWLEGVKVVRTWSFISPRKTFWQRIYHYGSFCLSAFYGGLLAGKPDILVNYSPPLPLGLTSFLLSKIWHVPWVIHVMDLFPDAAVAIGQIKNKDAISFFSKMELFEYRHASHISVISKKFQEFIQNKGIPSEKITMIPVWADPENIYPMPKENPFREKHNLTGKFVVMYAGNMGHTSCLGDVLVAAEILKDEPEVQFVFIGEGVKKDKLQEEAHRKKIKKILFLPYQPREILSELMAAADVSLVTLNHKSSHYSLPSKTFTIMASGRPILAVTPDDSELAKIIREADCGIQIPPEKPELLARTIVNIKQEKDRLEKMGINGRRQLEKTYCRYNCVDAYEKMLMGLNK